MYIPHDLRLKTKFQYVGQPGCLSITHSSCERVLSAFDCLIVEYTGINIAFKTECIVRFALLFGARQSSHKQQTVATTSSILNLIVLRI